MVVAANQAANALLARPRVLVLEWTDPPFAPGHWIPEMVELAGGVPALATAGTGDVLSGVLGAFLARGMAPFEAACAAVFAHAEAGRRATAALDGPDGVIASDVIDQLPHTLAA